MKKEFIGFYDPTEKEINDAWTKGTFAFDANTLLNLYRYSTVTRKDFLSALKTLKDKLFLPYQAALEFHNNRINVIEGLEDSYSKLHRIIEENYEKNLLPLINQFNKHPSILVEHILKLHSDYLKKVSIELEKQKKAHPDFKNKDAILTELTKLFDASTGREFSKEELKNIFIEGKSRYAENIPPGYKDLDSKQKKGEKHIYGDLIIWKELINYSKKNKKALILVTDDRKDDWWTIEKGKTIRPREELIKEFFDLTGVRILIYNADHFLKYAKEKKLVPQLKDKTIKEVKETRISDENSYVFNNPITIAEMLGNQGVQGYKPMTVAEIIGNQGLQGYKPMTVAEIIRNQGVQGYKPMTVAEIIRNQGVQGYKPMTVAEIIGNQGVQGYKPMTVAEIIGNQGVQGYKPMTVAEIIGNQGLQNYTSLNIPTEDPITPSEIEKEKKIAKNDKSEKVEGNKKSQPNSKTKS